MLRLLVFYLFIIIMSIIVIIVIMFITNSYCLNVIMCIVML